MSSNGQSESDKILSLKEPGNSADPVPAPSPAAEELLRSTFKYQDALVGYAFGLVQDWALAQDAVQEAFIVVQKKHAQFRAEASVFAWVKQIVRYEALNILRSRQREACVLDEQLFSLIDRQFEQYLDGEAVGALDQRKSALQHCMARLDSESVRLLMRFYRDARSCERLSELHHKSVNAVRLSLSRIRARLRECVRHQMTLGEVKP